MVSAVNFWDAWLPALVDSGSVLVMTAIGDDRAGAESFCALLRCPACARLLVVTEPQFRPRFINPERRRSPQGGCLGASQFPVLRAPGSCFAAACDGRQGMGPRAARPRTVNRW